MDYRKNIMIGYAQRKAYQKKETDKMDRALGFWRYALAAPHPLDKDKCYTTAVQRGKRQQVHNSQAEAEETGELQQRADARLCGFAGKLCDADRARELQGIG